MSSGNDSDITSPVEIDRRVLDGAAGLRLPQALIDRQTAFWRSALAGAPTLLELPTDHPRPQRQDFAGDTVDVRLDDVLVARLRTLGARHDARASASRKARKMARGGATMVREAVWVRGSVMKPV